MTQLKPWPWLLMVAGVLYVCTAQAADSPALKDNAREFLALRGTLKATTLTPDQMAGPRAPWRGRSVELYGRITARTNAAVSSAAMPITVLLTVPGARDLVMVDAADDSPLLAVDQVVHVLADLPDDAKPTDHFLLRALISEEDLPAAEQRYAAAEAHLKAQANLNAKPAGITVAPSADKNAKPEDVAPEVVEKPAAPVAAPAVARPGTKMPQLTASASKAVGVWKQWVSKINPKLTDTQLEIIVRSVLYYSALNGLDHRLTFAMIKCESDFNPKCLSHAGAMGLCQLMPFTAKEFGVDPWDLEQNIKGGVQELSQQMHRFPDKSNYEQCILGLACYNAGSGAVRRAGGVPNIPETQRYVKKVSDLFYQLWKSGMP